MRVLVIGATGGTGRRAVTELLARGHDVTAFARGAAGLEVRDDARLRRLPGDATDAADVRAAVAGHDAVVVALGIAEDALRVRLRGSRGTPMDVRSRGTKHVVAAMREHGVRRLVVLSSYGVGPTRDRLPLVTRLVFALVLAPQIADTERQEQVVRASGLDWVLAQPVNLTDDVAPTGRAVASTTGDQVTMRVTRDHVARFLAVAVADDTLIGHTVTLSGVADAEVVAAPR